MIKSKKIIAAALVLAMSVSAMPINTFASGAEIVASASSAANLTKEQQKQALVQGLSQKTGKSQKELNKLPLEQLLDLKKQLESIPEGLQQALGEAKAYGEELKKFEAANEAEKEQSIAQLLKIAKTRINGANNEAAVNKAVEEAKKDMVKLVSASSDVKAHKIKELVIKGKTIVAKLQSFEGYKEITKDPIAQINGAVAKLQNSGAQVQEMIKGLNIQIEKLGQKRIDELNGKVSEDKDKEREKDKIIDKIKDADSLDEIDDIYIPDYLKYDFDIIKAKSDRREDLSDDRETHYSDYRDEEKLDVRRIRINQDEDNRGKWIVEGYCDDHIREYVSIYCDGRFVGGGTTDGEGYFEITVNEKVEDNSSLKFYAGKNKYFEDDNSRIEPWDLKISTYYIEGKYNKDTFIKVYYRGRYVGEGRTNADGKFRIKSNEQIIDKDELKFYTNNKSDNNSKNINIISANVGDTKIVGTSSSYAEILVKDDDNIRLGNTKADINGNFTVLLNRALKNNELIKFTITDKDRDEINTEYRVGGMSNANLSRISYAKGYPDGNFKAGANISRAEAVMMFSRLINGSENFNTPNTTKFEDAEDGWYAQAINFVVDKGIMKGYPNGDFEPDSYITRAEFAEMVSRYVNKQNPGNSGLNDIKGHWAKNAIETLYGNKIIKGYPDGTFKPEENITRAEAVTVLNAVFDRKSTLNSMENISNKEMLITFNDVKKSDWYYAEVLDAANAHDSYRSGNTEVWTFVR